MILDAGDSSEIKYITNFFFLSNFNMSFQEKAQIQETLGSTNVSFFGQTARVYRFAGKAVDWPKSKNPSRGMQQSSITQLYNRHMRATELVKAGNIAVMKIANHLVYGYPLNFNVNYNANNDKLGFFEMSWVIARHTQNLPGLFDSDDLEKNYSVENITLSEEDAERLSNIQSYLNAFEENLITDLDIFTSFITTGSTLKFNIAERVVNYSGIGITDFNTLIRNFYGDDESSLNEFKQDVSERINNFADFISGEKNQSTETTFILSKFSESTLKEVTNGAADNMFKTNESFNTVANFLSLAIKIRNTLQNIKQQITI
jgi:hypothetical protein